LTTFFNLDSPDSTRKLATWVDDEIDTEQIICPINGGHMRGGKRLTDLSVELPNLPVDDIVWTWYSECLVQDRVLELCRKHNLTGFMVKPVKAQFKRNARKHPMPRLWELVVTGWAGMAPPESGIRLKYSCSACGDLEYTCFNNPTALIKESQWDGSDFIMVWPMPGFIFITDRVANVFRENRLRGFQLIDIGKMVCENGGSSGFGPGRLSHYMPEDLARKYGEPLGIY
jgi:hypothetical protein